MEAYKSLKFLLNVWFLSFIQNWADARIRSSDPSHLNLDAAMQQWDPSQIPLMPLGQPDRIDNDIPGEALNPEDFLRGKKMVQDYVDTTKQPDPTLMAGLFQGDIQLHSLDEVPAMEGMKDSAGQSRNAIKDLRRRWPNGVIPYVISSSYNQHERGILAVAIQQYHDSTCIRFVPRTVERDYIHILKGDGCSSSVGRVGGAQAVSLGPGCIYAGVVMHELMHAAGFWHEQSRSDRDNYITINWLNIQDNMEYNFQKFTWDTIQSLGVNYDTGSIMHYGPYAFAKDRSKPTIIPNNNEEIGQRRVFSKIDKAKLSKLYNCANTSEVPVVTEQPLTTPSPDKCEDSNKFCSTWADMGECTNNEAWMKVNCKKSCNQCGKECSDHNQSCDYWSSINECTLNAAYMHLFCMKSCGLCHSPEMPKKCEDKNIYCEAWGKSGQCRTNPNYMLIYCKKSCKQC